MNIKRVIIAGAGFSSYAGLPLQAGFTAALLDTRHNTDDQSRALVDELSKFINHVFDHHISANARFWPQLEDIFTSIDLSANAGHHLGNKYEPSKLRRVRRALLARTIWMLHQSFEDAKQGHAKERSKLVEFFKKLNLKNSAFIGLNWDTVIERMAAETRGVELFDYGCEAYPAQFMYGKQKVQNRKIRKATLQLPIVKMHGSVNWLYCDNCRRLYWFRPEESSKIAEQLRAQDEGDWTKEWLCNQCVDVRLTTRMATFSFLKALDFPMFQRSWFTAETILRAARKWVFIGYSLPSADYEFKYLLKRVQVSRPTPPEFVVITGKTNAEATYRNYQQFFGRAIKKRDTFFDGGLTPDTVAAALDD